MKPRRPLQRFRAVLPLATVAFLLLPSVTTFGDAKPPAITSPLSTTQGGTGVANGGTIAVGGAFAMSGAFTFTGTLTAATAVTFPTSGTLHSSTKPVTTSDTTNSTSSATGSGVFAGGLGVGQDLVSGTLNATGCGAAAGNPGNTNGLHIYFGCVTNVASIAALQNGAGWRALQIDGASVDIGSNNAAPVTIHGTLGLTTATWADNQTCTTGQMSVDASFVYICTATNTVKRAALSTF